MAMGLARGNAIRLPFPGYRLTMREFSPSPVAEDAMEVVVAGQRAIRRLGRIRLDSESGVESLDKRTKEVVRLFERRDTM